MLTSFACYVRFYFHIESIANLVNVYTRNDWTSDPDTGLTLIYKSFESQFEAPGDFWQKVEVQLLSAKTFQGI